MGRVGGSLSDSILLDYSFTFPFVFVYLCAPYECDDHGTFKQNKFCSVLVTRNCNYLQDVLVTKLHPNLPENRGRGTELQVGALDSVSDRPTP